MSTDFSFVAIDVETTGFSKKDSVIEVAAIEFNSNAGVCSFGASFEQLCFPESGSVPARVTEITGLEITDLMGKPKFMEIRSDFLAFVAGRKLIGHNISFDLRSMRIEKTTHEHECTYQLARKDKKKENKLFQACRRYGVPVEDDQLHGALYDAELCAQLYCRIKKIRRWGLKR
jgi:DNA polymerase III subunit epsilon